MSMETAEEYKYQGVPQAPSFSFFGLCGYRAKELKEEKESEQAIFFKGR